MSFGACTQNCGTNKGNVTRATCKKCGLSGLCANCLALECPTHRKPDDVKPEAAPTVVADISETDWSPDAEAQYKGDDE